MYNPNLTFKGYRRKKSNSLAVVAKNYNQLAIEKKDRNGNGYQDSELSDIPNV